MSLLAAEVPEVLVKRVSFVRDMTLNQAKKTNSISTPIFPNGKMFSVWSNKVKITVVVLALALYVYILVYLKTMYLRSKRLDSMEGLALKNEKLIKHIHGLDEQLAGRVNRLNEFYEDY